MKWKKMMIPLMLACMLCACGEKVEVMEEVTEQEYVLDTQHYDVEFLNKLKIENDYDYKSNINSHVITIPVADYEQGTLVLAYNNPLAEGNSWYLDANGYLTIYGTEETEYIPQWVYGEQMTLQIADGNVYVKKVNTINQSTLLEETGTDVYRFLQGSADNPVAHYYTVASLLENGTYQEQVTAAMYFDCDLEMDEIKEFADGTFSKITWYYIQNDDLTSAINLITNEQQDISVFAWMPEVLCDRLGDYGLKIKSPEYVTQLDYGKVSIVTDLFHHIFFLNSFGKDIGEKIEHYTKYCDYCGNVDGLDFFVYENNHQQVMALYKNTLVWYTSCGDSDRNMSQEEVIAYFFDTYR